MLKSILTLDINQTYWAKHKNLVSRKDFIFYKYSCITYALCGIVRYNQGSRLLGLFLIIQSFLSYMSDVHTLGKSSIWHPIDRYSAILVTIYHFNELKTIKSFMLNIIAFLIALIYLRKSQIEYENKNLDFLTYHTIWHLYAFILAGSSNI
jgi:hypothetical protein